MVSFKKIMSIYYVIKNIIVNDSFMKSSKELIIGRGLRIPSHFFGDTKEEVNEMISFLNDSEFRVGWCKINFKRETPKSKNQEEQFSFYTEEQYDDEDCANDIILEYNIERNSFKIKKIKDIDIMSYLGKTSTLNNLKETLDNISEEIKRIEDEKNNSHVFCDYEYQDRDCVDFIFYMLKNGTSLE